jgi:hypothetical protein
VLKSVVAASRSEKGTIQYQLAEGIDDPDEIRLWEEYASEEAFLCEWGRVRGVYDGVSGSGTVRYGAVTVWRWNGLSR